MDAARFAQLTQTFARFHVRFAGLFGRREAQQRSGQYLQGLIVQQTDRRNAENVAEAVEGATPRTLQRFLTEAPWDDGAVIDRVQETLAPLLVAPDAVFILDDTGFPKQGTHSVGVARQYSGTMGKVGNCQVGVFLAYASSRGHALVDRRLFLPEQWSDDRERCGAAGVPEDVQHETKPTVGLALLAAARQRGHLQSRWVTADAGYGEVPTFRDALDADGWWYVLEVPSTTRVFLQAARAAVPAWSGRGRRPTRLRLVDGEPPTVTVAATAATVSTWETLTVTEGAQGPRQYQFWRQRVWECRDGVPGPERWLLLRRNLDGSELKYALANAAPETPLLTLAQVEAFRWPVETGFQQYKGETGLDEYEVRSWRAWHHHTALALVAGAFLLQVQQEWGEKAAGLTLPQVTRVLRALLPHRAWTAADLCHWLDLTQANNDKAKRAHARRRERLKPSL
jgi:SRSO17 transposase